MREVQLRYRVDVLIWDQDGAVLYNYSVVEIECRAEAEAIAASEVFNHDHHGVVTITEEELP